MATETIHPLIPGLIGLASGVLFVMLKERLDLRSKRQEAASALSLFSDLLISSIRRRESANGALIVIDEITRRLIQCRFGETHGWADYLLVCEKYSIWRVNGFVDSVDIENDVELLLSIVNRIVVQLRS